ncbi:HlyD family type I secretion periplasmic adaptor subunit [Ferrimonas pelagia]|uniref:Membrane fusion protein (MFP) family protein n=1 Tax=Ferrimonas pelagia TaxID=1177826 RepID=A0ABP9EFI6_9GAMM
MSGARSAFELAPQVWLKRALWVIGLGFGGFLLWSGLTPLKSGTVVPAALVVGANAQVVAHREGGWIKAVHVADGESVERGQLLMEITDHRVEAEMDRWQERIWQLQAEQARIAQTLTTGEGEQLASVDVPQAIRKQQYTLMAQQLQNQQLIEQELAQKLSSRRNQLLALEIRQESLVARKVISDEEVEIAETLEQQAYLARMQMLSIRRSNAELVGAIGEIVAKRDALAADILALQSQLARSRNEFRLALDSRLAQIQAELTEATLSHQNMVAKYRAGQIYANNDGVIAGLRAQAVATDQIWPGEVLLRLVPHRPELVVEGLLPVTDIDNVWPGLITQVHFRALDGQDIAPLEGTVMHVDADPTVMGERTGYRFKVTLAPAQFDRLAQQKLSPGMPVDVFIQLQESTLLRYLLDPLMARSRGALREI